MKHESLNHNIFSLKYSYGNFFCDIAVSADKVNAQTWKVSKKSSRATFNA